MQFNHIIGNPPYDRSIDVKVASKAKSDKTRFNQIEKITSGYVYCRILIDNLKRLKENGTLRFVLPANWMTYETFIPFRNWLKEYYAIDRIDVCENLESQKYFEVGVDVVVLTISNRPPIDHTVFSYEFGETWVVNLNDIEVWPLFTSKSDYDLYLDVINDANHKTLTPIKVKKINSTPNKGYVTGNVVIGNKRSNFMDKWLMNQKLAVNSDHSENNQWAFEFDNTQQAQDYIAYSKTDEFKRLINIVVSGFKLQPYFLRHLGYR